MVEGWRSAVAGSEFRFCFKLPRSITHEARPSADELNAFMRVLEPLIPNLGPFLVQLPSRVGPGRLGEIEQLFRQLPHQFEKLRARQLQ